MSAKRHYNKGITKEKLADWLPKMQRRFDELAYEGEDLPEIGAALQEMYGHIVTRVAVRDFIAKQDALPTIPQHVYNLSSKELRQCECGRVKGKYNADGHGATVNGKGISWAVDNTKIGEAVRNMEEIQTSGYDDFYDKARVPMWIRPHKGMGNPRTTVDEDLGE